MKPKPPPHLDKDAAAEWRRITKEMDAAGILDAADRSILALYIQTWANYRSASREVATDGMVIVWPNGQVGPSPHYRIMKELAPQLRAMLSALGLTPAARARAQARAAAPVEEPGDLDI